MNIKQYLLCGLLLNVVGLSAMELSEQDQIDLCVEHVRDKIDEEILGVSKDIYFRGLIGTVASWWAADDITKEDTIATLQKVESYIELKNNKEIVFKKLIKRHKYVAHLMQYLADDKLEELRLVTGSTIDELCCSEHKNIFEKIIEECAIAKLSYEERIRNMVYGLCDKTDVTVLYGSTGHLFPVDISYDSKYLLSRDDQRNKIVWDMETGAKTNSVYEDIRWTFDHSSDAQVDVMRHGNYCAMSMPKNSVPMYVWDSVKSKKVPVQIKKNSSAIVLIQMPQDMSFVLRQALQNSKYDDKHLLALRKSKAIQKITGFVQDNIKEVVTNQISSNRTSD